VPMLSERRLTVVYDFESMNPSEKTKLLAYLKTPAEESCLALVSFERLAGKSKFERGVTAAAAVVECGRLSVDAVASVARRMGEERGLELADDALAVLVDWTDGELNRIANELGKLSCYVRDKREATLADVEFIVGAKASGLRDLALAIAERRPGDALALLDELIDGGAEAAQLVTQLYGLWTMLWSMRAASGRGTRGGSGAYLLSGVSNVASLAASRTSREYARGIEFFYKTDTDIRKGLSPEATVGLLVYELAGGA
jgi:DNA polymerase III delta subunit